MEIHEIEGDGKVAQKDLIEGTEGHTETLLQAQVTETMKHVTL